MRYCIICGNDIDKDVKLCPVCGASQEADFPQYGAGRQAGGPEGTAAGPGAPADISQYGAQGVSQFGTSDAPQYGMSDLPKYGAKDLPQYGMSQGQSPGTLQPQFGTPLYMKETRKKQEEEISKKRGSILIGLVAGVAVLLLVSVYFMVLLLTRNAFLDGSEKMRASIPVFGYTINGENYGELKLLDMKRGKTDGLYEMEVLYDVTLADERMEHRLTMEMKARNVFPFGWEVEQVTWSEKTQSMVSVKIEGIRSLVQEEVERGVPSHKVENFAVWYRGDSDVPAFEGDCVLGNPVGANYTLQGSYSYEGELAPSMQFERGICDYALTIRERKSQSLGVSYGLNKEMVTTPVYRKALPDGEVRLQITGGTGKGISVEAFRIYTDGRETEWGRAEADLLWDLEGDPLTGNPIASDRVGCAFALFRTEFQVIIGPETTEVVYNGEYLSPEIGIRLEPEGWTKPVPDVETTEG